MENKNNNEEFNNNGNYNNNEFNNGSYNNNEGFNNNGNYSNNEFNNNEKYYNSGVGNNGNYEQEQFVGQEVVEQSANKKDNRHYGKLFLTVLASFAVGATSVFGAQAVLGNGKSFTSSVTMSKEDKDTQETAVNAISKAKDAVVSIVNYQNVQSNSLDSILGRSSGSSNNSNSSSNSGDLKAASSGSGVIYKKSGNEAYIVTNNHVVEGAKKLSVILSDGTTVNAELVGTDIWTDLAVLKIDGSSVTTTMDFANSDDVAVGETAFAIGSPLDINLSNTVTKGIVSAVNRQIPMDIDSDGTPDWYQTVIQTDAAINPGNSGGALINSEGKLIGINESKIAQATSNVSAEGIGFVIPSNEVKLITEQLETSGKVERPALGVQLASVSGIDSQTLQSQLNFDGKQGVVIRSVESGSAAEQAGLQKYDIITKVNGEDVKDVGAIRKYLFEKVKIGDTVKVTYYRNGKEETTNVVMQALNVSQQ